MPSLVWEGAGVCKSWMLIKTAAEDASERELSRTWISIALITILLPIVGVVVPLATAIARAHTDDEVQRFLFWTIGIVVGVAIIIWIISAGVRMGIHNSRLGIPAASQSALNTLIRQRG